MSADSNSLTSNSTAPSFSAVPAVAGIDWERVVEESRPRYERLREILASYGEVLVAYSGGSDSAFLLAVANDVLGPKAVALTAVSAALAPGEREAAAAVARSIGAEQVELDSHELDRPGYAANASDRCYHCKSELYDIALAEASKRGVAVVVSGTNADELKDYRPGLRAASEHGVLHPMAEAGLTKLEIRAWSRRLGLSTWEKPQTPCLSSRLPYGTEVTRERLAMVGKAELAVRAAGIRVFRVRHHEPIARIEVAADEFAKLLDPQVRASIQEGVTAAGYAFAVIDLEPFRTGRLNEAAGLVKLGRS